MGSLDWLEDPVLGSEILVQDLLVAGAIFFLGIVLSSFMPRMIAKNIGRMIGGMEKKAVLKSSRKDSKKFQKEKEHIDRRMKVTVVKPVKRGLMAFYLLLFLVLGIISLNIEMGTKFRLMGEDFEAWRFLQFGFAFILLLVLSIYALEPILRALTYAGLGSSVKKSQKYRIYKNLRNPAKMILLVFGLFIALQLSFTSQQLVPFKWFVDGIVFIMIILSTYVVAQLLVTITEPQFRSKQKSKYDTGKAVGRVIKIGMTTLGVVLALLLMGIDPVTLLAPLAFLGIALALGLQDTVSNFAAGIMIVMDKPFIIGDRIRIEWAGNDSWGDVIDISLRSTWIKTPEDELVVIPNSMIASSQVWNYTRESPKVGLHFDVGISYDSDWKLAEKLMLEILNKHPLVLRNPDPYILMKEFADSSIIMTVWLWIPEARDKLPVKSDLLKRIKDSFDINGVEIPFPYRTTVYKTDLPKPKKLKGEYQSPIYLPSTGLKKFQVGEDSIIEMESNVTKILVPTSSSYPARYTAPYVMETAKKMGASVTALYIKPYGGSDIEGQRALRIYNEIAKAHGVGIKLLYREGDILEKILETVESEGASIVVMGSSEESRFKRLTRKSISHELMAHLTVPTMTIPISQVEKRVEQKRMQVENKTKEFQEEDVDMSSLGSLEKMEEESMEFDEE